MMNFCTLFNSNYLSRGLVMFDSLLIHCKKFHLYIFAFDDKTEEVLKKLAFKNITVISLDEFEDQELLKVKADRSAAEYCWTCTPSTILYCINKFNLNHCTYIDADMLFYSDPKVLIDEMASDSVLITEHRYSTERDLTDGSGKYCVQFIVFKNDTKGMRVLSWWRNACLQWCYARHEDGKFGDQKYLDDWTTRFDGIHVLKHLGGGLAPWNVQQYNFEIIDNRLYGTEIRTGLIFGTIFFHFHGFKFYENGIVAFTGSGYRLNKEVKNIFYFSYLKLLRKKQRQIWVIDNSFDSNGSAGKSPMKPLNFIHILKFYWYEVRLSLKSIFSLKFLNRIKHHHYHR